MSKAKGRPIQKTHDKSAINNDMTGTKRRRGTVQSYADSTDPESSSSSSSSEGESDFEGPPKKGWNLTAERKMTKNSAGAGTTKPVNRSGKRNTGVAKVAFSNAIHKKSVRTSKTRQTRNEDDSDDGMYEPVPSETSPVKFSSPIVKTNWDDRPDWRCAGAIDY